MKIKTLAVVAGALSILSPVYAGLGGFGLIGFQESGGLTTTITPTTSTVTSTVYYSTIVRVTTITQDQIEVSAAALSTTTITSPFKTETISSTYVTTVPGPVPTITSFTTSYESTKTVTASKTSSAGGPPAFGANGYLGLAAGVGALALI